MELLQWLHILIIFLQVISDLVTLDVLCTTQRVFRLKYFFIILILQIVFDSELYFKDLLYVYSLSLIYYLRIVVYWNYVSLRNN